MSTGDIARTYLAFGTTTGASITTSTGAVITSSSSTNTKGAYTQISASTDRQTDFMIVGISNWDQGTVNSESIDIAVGAAASEQVIVPDLMITKNNANAAWLIHYAFPISIPAGSRIACRAASPTASNLCNVNMQLFGGDLNYPSFSKVDAYGFTAATTLGTQVDPGASANTKGAYAQITAATNRDHFGLMWAVDQQGQTLAASAAMLFDIAVGGAGSEIDIIPNTSLLTSSAFKCFLPGTSGGVIPIQIPAGTRLSVRCQSTNNTSGTRKIGIVLYGFS